MRHRELQEILNAATRRFSRKGSALLWRDGMYGRLFLLLKSILRKKRYLWTASARHGLGLGSFTNDI